MGVNKKPGSFKRILFPTDFSEAAENAAAYAFMLARQHKAKVYALHVVDVRYDAAGFYVAHISYENIEREMKAAASGMLERFCEKNFKGFRNVRKQVLEGEPYKEILKVAKGGNIDIIVMGTSGKSGVDRVLFGSTTERVMRKALCPVLIIPPQK